MPRRWTSSGAQAPAGVSAFQHLCCVMFHVVGGMNRAESQACCLPKGVVWLNTHANAPAEHSAGMGSQGCSQAAACTKQGHQTVLAERGFGRATC